MAAAADAAGVTLPTWLAIALVIASTVGPIVGGIVGSILTYKAQNRSIKATRETAAEQHARETSKSNRELIETARTLIHDESEAAQAAGRQMLDGLAGIALSPADAVYLASVTREVTELRLSAARRAEKAEDRKTRFFSRRKTDEGGGS